MRPIQLLIDRPGPQYPRLSMLPLVGHSLKNGCCAAYGRYPDGEVPQFGEASNVGSMRVSCSEIKPCTSSPSIHSKLPASAELLAWRSNSVTISRAVRVPSLSFRIRAVS